MKIALVCHVYPPEFQTSAKLVRELAEDLACSGHDVTVLTGWPNHPAGVLYEGWRSRFRQIERDGSGFQVIRCGHSIHPRKRVFWRLWYYLTFAISTLLNGLAAGPCDAVLCLSTPLFGSWTAWMLARLKGARFVYDIFDLHPEAAYNAGLLGKGLVYAIWRRLDTLLCRWSDAIACLSDGMKESIVRRGIPERKVSVIHFWRDADALVPGDRMNPWRRRHGIPEGRFVAMYAGTIGYVSGAEVLVDVAERLSDRDDILLMLVGEGVVKDEVQGQVRARGLSNVRFLPFQPVEALQDMMATADVGLITLRPESGSTSVPSKIVGYLAAGRAVIASVAPDSETARVLREAECGVVVPAQDGAAMAAAIREAADNREGVEHMGQNARRCLLEKFARQRCTRKYEAVLTAPGR